MSYPPTYDPYGSAPSGPPPLHLPFYGATLAQAWGRFWKKYATFSGRASRSEFWWVVLISVGVSLATEVVGFIASGGDLDLNNEELFGVGDILSYIWSLLTLVPSLAVTVRRLHDIDRSGWWILIGLIPFVGWIILIVWNASAPNRYGERFDLRG